MPNMHREAEIRRIVHKLSADALFGRIETAVVELAIVELVKLQKELGPTTIGMILGLVRAAECREREEGGKLWDDECRKALAQARELGWGASKIGRLA